MGRENTAKTMAQHGFTQFDLSKKVLNNLSQYHLKPTAKLVLLYLCDCYNPKHGEMFPKQSTIAAKLGVSEVSVTRAIQELHKEGLLISERKYTNKYRFTSRIVSGQPNNLIDDNNQKDMKEPIKKIAPCNRTNKKEQKKEQTEGWGGNVYFSNFSQAGKLHLQSDTFTPEEYRILKDYAIKHNARNINAYIAKLKQNGSDKSILKDYRKKAFITCRAQQNIQETKQLIKSQQELTKTAITPFESSAIVSFKQKHGL